MEKLTPERRQWIADQVLPWEPSIRNWLRRYARISPTDLDDVIQEAYAQLCDEDFASIQVARQFFQRIVRNRFLDYRRRLRVTPIDHVGELQALPIEEAIGPERVVSARQEYERLLEVLNTLPPQQRTAFQFRKFKDMSVAEISRRMGVGKKTVQTHLQRAKAQILTAMYGADAAVHRGGQNDDDEQARR